MGRPWQRMVGCTAAVVLALLVSGCEVRGTVEVKSGTEAVADLVFTESEADCLGLTKFAGLIIKGVPESDGHQTCRAQGTIDLEALKELGITLTQTGEYVIVDLALPQRVGSMPLEIDISFPGVVVEDAGMPVTGNSVRLGNATGISDFSPARFVALSHPGPQWWVIGLSSGFAGGVGLTLVLLWLFGRRRRLAARPLSPVPPEPSTTVRDPEYEALFAPPSADEPARVPLSPAPSGKAGEAEPGADHRVWGPPGDRGDPID